MTGEVPNPSPDKVLEQVLDLVTIKALGGFVLITRQDPKSPESRSLDLWRDEAAGLRTDQDRIEHFRQRFDEYIAEPGILGHLIAKQEELGPKL